MKTKDPREVQARTIMYIVKRMSRNYHCGFPIVIDFQLNKVFNHGMGSLAFVRAVPEYRVLILNSLILNKRELERFTRMITLFKGWRIVFERLGYPEWYQVKDLKTLYMR